MALGESNGSVSIGIAAGSDATLGDGVKLHINVRRAGGNRRECVNKDIQFALSHVAPREDAMQEMVVVSAVSAIFVFGLTCEPGFDADTILSEKEGPYVHEVTPNQADVRNAALLMVSTKINYFQTNHHTGAGSISGYPRKILMTAYGVKVDAANNYTDLVHMVGHWCSTTVVLDMVGVKGLKVSPSFGCLVKLSFERDVMLRSGGNPAGTAAINLCYNILLRLRDSAMCGFMPNVEAFAKVVRTYREISANPARYHIHSKSLTGRDRLEHDDNIYRELLGILGSFIHVFFNTGTLAKSPLIVHGSEEVFKNYPTYDPSLYALMSKVYKITMRAADVKDEEIIAALGTSVGGCIRENKEKLNGYFEEGKDKEEGGEVERKTETAE